jgi:hypothetical protein
MLLKQFHKIERKGMQPSSIYEANITLIAKLIKNMIKTESYKLISLIKFSMEYLQTKFRHT